MEQSLNHEKSNPIMDLLNVILERVLLVEQEIKEYSPKDKLNSKEAAKYLNVKMDWLNKLCSQDRLPYTQPGGKIRVFNKADLDKYLKKNLRKSDDDYSQEADKIIS